MGLTGTDEGFAEPEPSVISEAILKKKKMKFYLVSTTVIWGFLILWKLTLEMYSRLLIVTCKILSALMGLKYLT